ncbi:hypothetical protein [Paenibacillus tepidiphilus]|uniref:hypothetical protein n=1 Tax=Paenibacillus tepidiphilus TaxID=2608683 RepID=UPI00123BC2DC|nr:hypothetical protein [Paenibacillus tepidiphilus]
MRGGIPLLPRSARKRSNRKRDKAAVRKLRSGVACSILFLLVSQQVGSTYAGFTDNAELENTISFCAVFPGSAKQQLLALRDHIQKAAALQSSLKGYTSAVTGSGISGIEAMSLEELDAAELEASARIASLQTELNSANDQMIANNHIWSEIAAELNAASAVLTALGGAMQNLDPSCVDFKDTDFFNELQSSIGQSGVLSESFNESIEGIIRYLRSAQNQGNLFAAGVADIVYGESEFGRPELLQPLPFLITLQDGNLSSGLSATYDSYTAELTEAKAGAAAGIAELESQRALISEIRGRRLEEARLEELEKAKQAEEEKKAQEAQLAEEQKQQEEAAGEQTESEPGDSPVATPPAPPEAVPSPEAIEAIPPAGEVQEEPAVIPEATAIPEPSKAPEPDDEPAAAQ